jgi:hypothetical protein
LKRDEIYGNDYTQICRKLYSDQPVAGALSQSELALVYGLRRVQPFAVVVYQFLPAGDHFEENGCGREVLLRGGEGVGGLLHEVSLVTATGGAGAESDFGCLLEGAEVGLATVGSADCNSAMRQSATLRYVAVVRGC